MTVVEFFDKNAVENIVSSLLCKPDKVIFVGNDYKKMKASCDIYSEILSLKGINIEFECKSIDKNRLEKIIEVFSEIVEKEGFCHFDLSGGDELFLVAVGIISERFKDKAGLHKYNIISDKFYDCDMDGKPSHEERISLSVAENIAIYGGKLLKSEPMAESPEEIEELLALWKISKANPTKWNIQINSLGISVKQFIDETSLSVMINREKAKKFLESRNEKFVYDKNIFSQLEEFGLISKLRADDNTICFEYKSPFVKRMLSKAGNVLEQYTGYICKISGAFCDVMCGVSVGWSPDENTRVENEIDVIAMKNAVPVFISCKNGGIDSDELYKLETVSEEFGGKYAKKLIVASNLEKCIGKTNAKYIAQRTAEMNIRIISDAAIKPEKEIIEFAAAL